MKNKVYVIGAGPGSPGYLLPLAREKIEECDVLIGARRLLALFQNLNKEEIELKGNFENVISCIKENGSRKIAILVSGDPGLHSFLGQISRFLKRDEYEVIPGISALQIAFARIGEAWQDTKILSLHGKNIDSKTLELLLKEVKHHSNLFLFTDSNFPPECIARYLIENGIKNRRAIVFEKLTYPDERIVDIDLEGLSRMEGFHLCVMVIKKEDSTALA